MFALSQVAFYFAFKFVVGSLDPTKAKRQEAKAKSNRVLGKLGVSGASVIVCPIIAYAHNFCRPRI